MYNRYMRHDAGGYRCADAKRNEPSQEHAATDQHAQCDSHHNTPLGGLFGKNGPLSGILGKLNPSDLDTGDLLLLVLIFLLFREGGDEELLIALGLLLIL